MDLTFRTELATAYRSGAQKTRVLTEDWVGRSIYCPNCGHPDIVQRKNNSRVADFFCPDCREEYEVKSLSKPFREKVEDGEYQTMMRRLQSDTAPSLFLMQYDKAAYAVVNFIVIPKHFLLPDSIEARNPLSPTARRAGWTGCRILLRSLPQVGRIFLIRDQVIEPRQRVLALWKQTLFLRDHHDSQSKGWLLNVMKCIEKIGLPAFTLDMLYTFEDDLRRIYPANQHIREKVRQQLQVLRDKGYLKFTGSGRYRLTPSG